VSRTTEVYWPGTKQDDSKSRTLTPQYTVSRPTSNMEFLKRKPRARGINLVACTTVLIALPACTFSEARSASGSTAPTYTKDVAAILLKNCVKCHRSGELAFRVPLTSYDAVKSRAERIKEKVMSREMPPWPADPATSLKIRNDPRLSQKDIDIIVAWVNAGTPKGNDADLPPPPKFDDDSWMHPQRLPPDLIISLPGDMHLPAEGAVPYAKVLVKVPFSDDRWVAAAQTRPSNPAVVHHMALTEVALPEGMTPSDEKDVARQLGLPSAAFESPAVTTSSDPPQPDMLSIYTPGTTLETYTGGSAKLLKGGRNMYVIFNIHYETTGKPETDRSRIALWFRQGPPERQLFRVNGAGQSIIANGKELLTDDPGTKAEGTPVAIPPIAPFEENYELIGMTAFPEPITIYQFQPHAHHRGKDFTYSVVYPDGREQTLLSVPHYDHRWQMAYELETPLQLPAGSKLVVTAHYDNSKMKMHNPAPEKPVYFRDMNQSWDEMFTPFVQYSIDDQHPAALDQSQNASTNSPRQPEGTQNNALQIVEVVGCLEANPVGRWLLTSAGQPTPSETEATSSTSVKAADSRPLGSERYELLGVRVFNPSRYQGRKIAARGVLLPDSVAPRINVTSLQPLASPCTR
jgi:mono/diheme cytochrome c family protein